MIRSSEKRASRAPGLHRSSTQTSAGETSERAADTARVTTGRRAMAVWIGRSRVAIMSTSSESSSTGDRSTTIDATRVWSPANERMM